MTHQYNHVKHMLNFQTDKTIRVVSIQNTRELNIS